MLELLLPEPQVFSVCTTSGMELSGAAFGERGICYEILEGVGV